MALYISSVSEMVATMRGFAICIITFLPASMFKSPARVWQRHWPCANPFWCNRKKEAMVAWPHNSTSAFGVK